MFPQQRQRIHNLIWNPDLVRTFPLRIVVVIARYIQALIREVMGGQLTLRAMSLVYTTLMSLVPLLAFSFSLLKGVGVHRQMEPLLLTFLAPLGEEKSLELTTQLIAFVDNLQGTLLGGVGLIFLIFIVISMVQKVEDSMNYIWQVQSSRTLASKFSGYLSAMLMGPLMMALALGLIATISSVAVVQRVLELEPFGTLLVATGRVMPYLILAATFTFLYVLLPNTRVRLKPALIGGLLGGIAWAAASSIFAQVVVQSTRISAVYSSFAIVILALVWLYVSWLILLLGAQIAYFVQHPEHLREGRSFPELSALSREHTGLALMLLVGRAFVDPELTAWHPRTLAARFRLPEDRLAPVLESLRAARLLVDTADGQLMPGRSLEKIRLVDIMAAVRGSDEIVPRAGDRWAARSLELWAQADDAIAQRFGNVSLAELVTDVVPAASDTASDQVGGKRPAAG